MEVCGTEILYGCIYRAGILSVGSADVGIHGTGSSGTFHSGIYSGESAEQGVQGKNHIPCDFYASLVFSGSSGGIIVHLDHESHVRYHEQHPQEPGIDQHESVMAGK